MSPTHQMIITAMLVLLCYPSQVTLASIAQCTETNSIANRVLVGHAFFTKQSPDIEDCVISCINRDPLCDSTNYYRETKVCELNDKNAESNPDDLVDYEWAIYMTNSVRFLRCNNFDYECERQTDICQIKQGGNKCEGKNQTASLESIFSNSLFLSLIPVLILRFAIGFEKKYSRQLCHPIRCEIKQTIARYVSRALRKLHALLRVLIGSLDRLRS